MSDQNERANGDADPSEKPNLPANWLICRSTQEWHDWLAKNHALEKGVWLLIRKVGAAGDGVLREAAVTEAIRFGWIDSQMHSLGTDHFILRFTPRRPKSNWSPINRRLAERLIREGSMEPSGMAAIEAAQADGRWQAAGDPTEPSDLG